MNGMPFATGIEKSRGKRFFFNQSLVNMKMKKSAAKAALKPNSTVSQPNSVNSAAVSAPKELKANPVVPQPNSGAVATIDVKMDVGFGNAIFLRGQGSGLTWDRGIPLVCVDGKTWRWAQTVNTPIKFKILLNDKVWSEGSDLTIAPGQKLEVAPHFV
jgi:hypothetical protein